MEDKDISANSIKFGDKVVDGKVPSSSDVFSPGNTSNGVCDERFEYSNPNIVQEENDVGENRVLNVNKSDLPFTKGNESLIDVNISVENNMDNSLSSPHSDPENSDNGDTKTYESSADSDFKSFNNPSSGANGAGEENKDGVARAECSNHGVFPIDVTVRDYKSDSELLDSDNCVPDDNGEREDDDVASKLGCSADAATSAAIRRQRHARKNARSRSWCARSGDDGLSVADIRLLRERLLRTQSHPQTGAIRGFTGAQKMTLVSLALVDFMSFCSMSIMAPFFPREASEKGMTDAVSGFVFSFYALVMFITSPFFGKILPTVGAKFLLLSGVFLAGSCNLLFGVLEYIYDYKTFTTFCFLIRGLEAVGASAYSTASYVFVVNTFPDNIGSVLGILETFIGLGMSVGPAIGGLLYSIGGFGLPFYVLGIAMVVTMPINWILLPNQEDYTVSSKSVSLLELVKVPAVVITGLVIVVVSNTWAFLDPTLEPHLRQFDLNAEQVGLIFLLFSGLYGIFSPVWGYLADRIDRHWCMMVWGLMFCTLGLLLLGPSPLLPFLKSSLWLNLVGLSIIGISVALTLLPTFQGVLTSSIEEGGCGDNLGTYSVVAGVWSCMYSLGEVIGPSLGGVLLKNFGFPICSTVMAALTFILAIITLTFFALKENSKFSNSASESFSDSTSPGESWVPSSPPLEQVLDEHHPLLSSGDSGSGGSNKRVRQSYGGTGITTKHGKELNQNQHNVDNPGAAVDHFKLKYLFRSKPKPESQSDTLNEQPTTIDGLRALIQSDLYQKYLDNSVIKMDNNIEKFHQHKENPFIFDIRNNISEEMQLKNGANLVPILIDPRSNTTDLMSYTKDKVKYYNQSRQDDCEDLILDRHQVTDVRGTINITSRGACEV